MDKIANKLTARERDILMPLCEGHSNKALARILNIAEGTVKVHLNSIYAKLGVANRTALVALVYTGKTTVKPLRGV